MPDDAPGVQPAVTNEFSGTARNVVQAGNVYGGVHLNVGAAPAPAPERLDNLPPRNPFFTGRADLLEDLAPRLEGGPVAVLAVRGLGGIGKSSLALEYAHRTREAGRYAIVWWVRADSPVTRGSDLTSLAEPSASTRSRTRRGRRGRCRARWRSVMTG